MKLEDLKRIYGGREDAVKDTCQPDKPANDYQVCLCTATELKDGKWYEFCRRHNPENVRKRSMALDKTLSERRNKTLTYPPLLPARTQTSEMRDVTEYKPKPDSHLGGVESSEVDWYGEGYEYGV